MGGLCPSTPGCADAALRVSEGMIWNETRARKIRKLGSMSGDRRPNRSGTYGRDGGGRRDACSLNLSTGAPLLESTARNASVAAATCFPSSSPIWRGGIDREIAQDAVQAVADEALAPLGDGLPSGAESRRQARVAVTHRSCQRLASQGVRESLMPEPEAQEELAAKLLGGASARDVAGNRSGHVQGIACVAPGGRPPRHH